MSLNKNATKNPGASLAPTKALIYCRVSSPAQLRRGDGLASQEATCREYARARGLEVDKVFGDNLTGNSMDRPELWAMLRHLRKFKREGRVVIVDNIDRFAKDIRGHWDLRDLMKEAGGNLESPRHKFGDDPDSVFMENVLASVAQHQREKNAWQTKDRMKGRVINGHWPFAAPVGYRHELKPGEGKILIRDEPVASIVQEALEGYASGRFQSQGEVLRFFESHRAFSKNRSGKVRFQQVYDILSRILYAGYVEAPNWNVSLRKGRHEPLIDLKTYERIQHHLKGGTRASVRADIGADFPLRGHVGCAECGKPMTSCWSTSHTGEKYPYYTCFRKGCSRYRKSVRREKIEGAFVTLLESLTPSAQLVDLARAMFKNAWEQRRAQAVAIAKSHESERVKVASQIDALVNRIVDATSPAVVAAYEKRITELERTKAVLAEKSQRGAQPARRFEDMFELAMRFLASPSKIWEMGKIEYQKLVLRLAFADCLLYCPKSGFRTPQTSLPFKVLQGVGNAVGKMARPKGFEPLTSAFGAI